MQYKYFSVYCIDGIHLPKETAEIIITDDKSKGTKILLTNDIEAHSLMFDRHDALANNLLNSMFGGSKLDLSSEKLAEDGKKIRNERNRKYGNSLFLIFEFTGNIDFELPEITVDREAYFLPDLIDNIEIINKFRSEISRVFTSLLLVSKQDFNVTKITGGIYLISESEKPIFSFNSSFTLNPIISSPLDGVSLIKISNYNRSISNDKNFESINRLLLNANLEHKDNLRSFLFIWTAMEIFIGLAVKNYKSKFTPNNFLTKKQENSELARNFYSVSSFLTNHKHQQDYKEFVNIKKLRNEFIHNSRVSENKLPTDKLKVLLKRYLSLHLENNP